MGFAPAGDPHRPVAEQEVDGASRHCNSGCGLFIPSARSAVALYSPSVARLCEPTSVTLVSSVADDSASPIFPSSMRAWQPADWPPHWAYSGHLRRLASLSGHSSTSAWCVAHDSSGRLVCTGADDGLIKLWSCRTGMLQVGRDRGVRIALSGSEKVYTCPCRFRSGDSQTISHTWLSVRATRSLLPRRTI
jgi:WD40 repeat protein